MERLNNRPRKALGFRTPNEVFFKLRSVALQTCIRDIAEKNSRLMRDRGAARLVECADAALAELIAGDERTKVHCLRGGERHLVVPAESEARFRKALHQLGYCLLRES